MISAQAGPASELRCTSAARLATGHLQPGDNLDQVLAEAHPMALAWDMAHASPGEWRLVQHIRNHPQLCQLPFILFDPGAGRQLRPRRHQRGDQTAGEQDAGRYDRDAAPAGSVRAYPDRGRRPAGARPLPVYCRPGASWLSHSTWPRMARRRWPRCSRKYPRWSSWI